MRTFSNDLGQGTLNNITNLGFDPAGKFLVEGNDKIIVESFDSLNSVVIKDPSVKDLDIMTIALSDKTTNEFRAEMENIETLHVKVSGQFDDAVKFSAKPVSGLKTLEFAGSTDGAIGVNATSNLPNGVTKIDASGLTDGFVIFNANGTSVTTLIGGAGKDDLTIGSEGGTLTGGQGSDTFVVSNAINKLVTITDIASKDTIILGNSVKSTADATELIITQAADETTFVAELQKVANTQTADGLYYATFNGNTYVIANGATSGQKINGKIDLTLATSGASLSSATGTFAPSSTSISSSAFSKGSLDGTITLTGATVSSGVDLVAASLLTISATSATITGTVTYTPSGSTAPTHTLTITGGTASAGTLTAPGKTDTVTLNGTEYNLSEFIELKTVAGSKIDQVSFDVVTGSAGGDLSGGSFSAGDTVTLNGTTSGGTVTLTGLQVEGMLAGSEAALKDDIIIKLSGTHNIPTEADVSIDNLGIASLNFV